MYIPEPNIFIVDILFWKKKMKKNEKKNELKK